MKLLISYTKSLGNHWFVLVVLFLGISLFIGGVGEGFGIPHLFRDDPELGTYGWQAYRNSPAFLTQAAATLLVGVMWTLARLLDTQDVTEKVLLRNSLLGTVCFSVIPLLAAMVIAPLGGMPWPDSAEVFRMFFGTIIGLCLTFVFGYIGIKLCSWLGERAQGRTARTFVFLLVFLLLVVPPVALWPKLVPAVSLLLLLGIVTSCYFVLQLLPRPWRILGFVIFVVAISFGNSVPFKYQFPNFNNNQGISYYEPSTRLKLPSENKPESFINFSKQQQNLDQQANKFLIDPLKALAAWKRHIGQESPKLVVVATSGGAYRASFWTAIVLDALNAESRDDGDLPEFTDSIRLLTGASGGMVGAAYFVAMQDGTQNNRMIVDQIEKETKEAQRDSSCLDAEHFQPCSRLVTQYPIRRDSLSPVAQQLVQRDILNAFLPWTQELDRGRVLESQWISLFKSFAELREGELSGQRASLILSPMLVETGQPLLISNLDLSSIRTPSLNEAVELFRMFPDIHNSFRLATAVRMNATFPYVSPAVSLPTEPLRRVVDAGYYDNYGINLLVAYLRNSEIRGWIKKNTSGVVILQIRAFPIESISDQPYREVPSKHEDKLSGGAFHWLTSPVEGAAAAREASMVFRNNQELRALADLYEPGFIEWFTFENSKNVSMSWYVPASELACMYEELSSAHNNKQLENLKQFWKAAPKQDLPVQPE